MLLVWRSVLNAQPANTAALIGRSEPFGFSGGGAGAAAGFSFSSGGRSHELGSAVSCGSAVPAPSASVLVVSVVAGVLPALSLDSDLSSPFLPFLLFLAELLLLVAFSLLSLPF